MIAVAGGIILALVIIGLLAFIGQHWKYFLLALLALFGWLYYEDQQHSPAPGDVPPGQSTGAAASAGPIPVFRETPDCMAENIRLENTEVPMVKREVDLCNAGINCNFQQDIIRHPGEWVAQHRSLACAAAREFRDRVPSLVRSRYVCRA